MLNEIIKIVKEAGEIYLSAKGDLGVEEKDSAVNLVTKYDKLIQDFLTEKLSALVPEAAFFDEEGDENSELTEGLCFIIDPIDGTTNFIKGYQHSAISVALAKDREPVLGVVYDPDLKNMFYGQKDGGAYLNGKKITASRCDMQHSLVLFGTCPYERELTHPTFALTEKVFDKCVEVRRGGSAALDICYVACGKADLYYELILRPWDWAAGVVILKEAGGFSSKCDGTPLDAGKVDSFACGNAQNLKEFYEIYKL